jgi:DnaD/phage-associated family protein
MNYIQEINAFYIKIEMNPLSASAHTLWHTLLHLNNRSGWLQEFTVAAAVICYKSGLPPSTFKRARNELRDKGYISYNSRGSLAPVYRMVSIVEKADEVVLDGALDDELGEMRKALKRHATKPAEDVDVKKHATIPVKEASVSQRIIQFYMEHFGKPTQPVRVELSGWIGKLSESHVYEALKRAVESGNENWSYAKGILTNWKRDQLVTIEDVLQAEKAFRMRRGSRSAQAGSGTKEIIPDWFYERKRAAAIR